nr:ribonuclease H-like domain-containing protein [Tanacetum cinerariifolium]
MINSIQNGDQPLPVIAQVSLAGNAQNAPPTLKDPKFWTAEEGLARSLLIQGLPNDIYSLIDSNETAKDLWDALERQMRGFEYGEQDRKAAILYEKSMQTRSSWLKFKRFFQIQTKVLHLLKKPLLRFMNYLKKQTDGEAMINSIQNGDQPLPVIAQVSLAGNAQNAPPTLKDPKFWTAEEKNT